MVDKTIRTLYKGHLRSLQKHWKWVQISTTSCKCGTSLKKNPQIRCMFKWKLWANNMLKLWGNTRVLCTCAAVIAAEDRHTKYLTTRLTKTATICIFHKHKEIKSCLWSKKGLYFQICQAFEKLCPPLSLMI